MKDLKAFITELAGSDALKTGLAEALKNNKLPEFLKENDCDADPAELVEILRRAVAPKEDEAMSADEMDAVAGGGILLKWLGDFHDPGVDINQVREQLYHQVRELPSDEFLVLLQTAEGGQK